MNPAPNECRGCGDWRNSITGRKTCLNMGSPLYQHETRARQTCSSWSLLGTTGRALRQELTKRETAGARKR